MNRLRIKSCCYCEATLYKKRGRFPTVRLQLAHGNVCTFQSKFRQAPVRSISAPNGRWSDLRTETVLEVDCGEKPAFFPNSSTVDATLSACPALLYSAPILDRYKFVTRYRSHTPKMPELSGYQSDRRKPVTWHSLSSLIPMKRFDGGIFVLCSCFHVSVPGVTVSIEQAGRVVVSNLHARRTAD